MAPIGRFKRLTDAVRLSAREEMRRLQAFYRGVGRCDRCGDRLVYDRLNMEAGPGAWEIVADRETKKERAVCKRCSDSPAGPAPAL